MTLGWKSFLICSSIMVRNLINFRCKSLFWKPRFLFSLHHELAIYSSINNKKVSRVVRTSCMKVSWISSPPDLSRMNLTRIRIPTTPSRIQTTPPLRLSIFLGSRLSSSHTLQKLLTCCVREDISLGKPTRNERKIPELINCSDCQLWSTWNSLRSFQKGANVLITAVKSKQRWRHSFMNFIWLDGFSLYVKHTFWVLIPTCVVYVFVWCD